MFLQNTSYLFRIPGRAAIIGSASRISFVFGTTSCLSLFVPRSMQICVPVRFGNVNPASGGEKDEERAEAGSEGSSKRQRLDESGGSLDTSTGRKLDNLNSDEHAEKSSSDSAPKVSTFDSESYTFPTAIVGKGNTVEVVVTEIVDSTSTAIKLEVDTSSSLGIVNNVCKIDYIVQAKHVENAPSVEIEASVAGTLRHGSEHKVEIKGDFTPEAAASHIRAEALTDYGAGGRGGTKNSAIAGCF